MGNLEKPLTWGLGILFVLGLFIVNCECSDGTTCPINKAFNISTSSINGDALKVDVAEIITEEVEEEAEEEVPVEAETTADDVSDDNSKE
jgi:hypothetical protein